MLPGPSNLSGFQSSRVRSEFDCPEHTMTVFKVPWAIHSMSYWFPYEKRIVCRCWPPGWPGTDQTQSE
jgi:hypothetical protein